MQKKTYVLYHRDADGVAAAAVCKQALKNTDDVMFISVQYGEPFPTEIELHNGVTIFIVDFSYDSVLLDEINEIVDKLVVIDHHESAMGKLEHKPYALFDMTISGCELTYKYFYPKQPIPFLLQLVGDRDLWKFKYGLTTKALYQGINDLGKANDIDFYNSLLFNEKGLYDVIDKGMPTVQLVERMIYAFISNSNNYTYKVTEGNIVALYNTTVLHSEIADALLNQKDIKVDVTCSYMVKDGKMIFSFRSKEGKAKHYAELYGGGGHANAAGTNMSMLDGFNILEELYALDDYKH